MRCSALVGMTIALVAAGGLLAQSGADAVPATAKARPSGKSGSVPRAGARKDIKAKLAITPEREAAALTFVERNHPELTVLLEHLKSSQPDEYERAMRDIFRTVERLGQIQERDPVQYELEVAAWTAQSRVQLLAAKMRMGATDELKKQLREALGDQNDAKLALLKHDRQKTADRLARIEGDIARFENDREKIIARQLQLLTRNAADGRTTKLGPKNAAKTKKNGPANAVKTRATQPAD